MFKVPIFRITIGQGWDALKMGSIEHIFIFNSSTS